MNKVDGTSQEQPVAYASHLAERAAGVTSAQAVVATIGEKGVSTQMSQSGISLAYKPCLPHKRIIIIIINTRSSMS